MPTDHRAELARIKRFDQLVAYLRDEMDWPIEGADFEDLTFDYTPEELGIDAANAAKIQAIKRLRPLSANQPWGIFFVKFEPKRLPVVALRRILSRVVLKKRAAANSAERAAWQMADLLFISNYGDKDERRITFAHFVQDDDMGDLPTLKVLGWDGDDTKLHLDHVATQLRTNLRWPDDDADAGAWRAEWASAFTLGHREVITTSKRLAESLADLARATRKKALAALAIETPNGPLRKLMGGFKKALIHDLDEDGFADMYAQTIAYGLLSARISRPAGLVADNMADLVPVTNPFLKEMLENFLRLSGRRRTAQGSTGIDFDELGINEMVQLLREANMEAVVRDFGDRNPQEDPVIHFYEHFLKEYDAKKRMQRGVFYTPRPVVSYIVRSVDELLRTEFGLTDGLADTTTWSKMVRRYKDLKIPDGVSPDQAFVQILDPATGTGTFLVEVIGLIHRTMVAKWKVEGHRDKKIEVLWNAYVPKHLLPRLHGYELLMAPYAIAHLKIGLKLSETGYRFGSDERARVYMTNALEPASDKQLTLDFLPALAHEAQAVNEIKHKQLFTVVIGNPPYSNFGQLNKNPFILGLLEDYKRGLDDKKINLDDDFIKFIRFSEAQINTAGVGVHGMITNNAYLDGLTHRRMRQRLMQSFPLARIANLHGSSKKKEKAPDGTPDENVFDITVGVAIGIFCRVPDAKATLVYYADFWGNRETKTKQLTDERAPVHWLTLNPIPDNFFFVPKDFSSDEEYRLGWSIRDAFTVSQNGLKTDRDELFFDFERDALVQRMRQFYLPNLEPQFREKYRVVGSSSYDIEARRLATNFAETNIRRCLYRPMDDRWLYYEPNLTSRPAEKVMKHMLVGSNLGLISTRQTQEKWGVLVTNQLCGHKSCAAYDINTLFPLYLYEHSLSFDSGRKSVGSDPSLGQHLNLSAGFLRALAAALHIKREGQHGLPAGVKPEDIFYYAYAVFHSPGYRKRYAEFLKIDFPRLPLPGNLGLFRDLIPLGGELVALHLLESPKLDSLITTYTGPNNPEVGRVGWSNNTVWLDAAKTNARQGQRAIKPGVIGFHGVPEAVWDFHIGGYQVCHKWLKDRKGRTLSHQDIAHYQKIAVALNETIRLMQEIDEVIEQHGGWPGAFAEGE